MLHYKFKCVFSWAFHCSFTENIICHSKNLYLFFFYCISHENYKKFENPVDTPNSHCYFQSNVMKSSTTDFNWQSLLLCTTIYEINMWIDMNTAAIYIFKVNQFFVQPFVHPTLGEKLTNLQCYQLLQKHFPKIIMKNSFTKFNEKD